MMNITKSRTLRGFLASFAALAGLTSCDKARDELGILTANKEPELLTEGVTAENPPYDVKVIKITLSSDYPFTKAGREGDHSHARGVATYSNCQAISPNDILYDHSVSEYIMDSIYHVNGKDQKYRLELADDPSEANVAIRNCNIVIKAPNGEILGTTLGIADTNWYIDENSRSDMILNLYALSTNNYGGRGVQSTIRHETGGHMTFSLSDNQLGGQLMHASLTGEIEFSEEEMELIREQHARIDPALRYHSEVNPIRKDRFDGHALPQEEDRWPTTVIRQAMLCETNNVNDITKLPFKSFDSGFQFMRKGAELDITWYLFHITHGQVVTLDRNYPVLFIRDQGDTTIESDDALFISEVDSSNNPVGDWVRIGKKSCISSSSSAENPNAENWARFVKHESERLLKEQGR